MGLVALGWSNVQVAEELRLSPNTIKSHMARIGTKLDTGDRAGIVGEAYRRGLLTPRAATVADLTREHFGRRVTCERGTGWLYGIHDDFHDGYPARTLIVVTSEDGDDATWQFTDSDPSGYPKTMSTPVTVTDE